jgi:hypothetical protein
VTALPQPHEQEVEIVIGPPVPDEGVEVEVEVCGVV